MEHVSGITASATYTTSSGTQSYQDVSSTATANQMLDVAEEQLLEMPTERALEFCPKLLELFGRVPAWSQRISKIQDILYAKDKAEKQQKDKIIKEVELEILANVMQQVNTTMTTGYNTETSTLPNQHEDNGKPLPPEQVTERFKLVIEDMQSESEFNKSRDYGVIYRFIDEGNIKEVTFFKSANHFMEYLKDSGVTKVPSYPTIHKTALKIKKKYPDWEEDGATPEELQHIKNIGALFLNKCRKRGFHYINDKSA